MRHLVDVLALAFEYKRQRHDVLKQSLCKQIRMFRGYLADVKGGAFDYLNSYPCGHQDAHGEKVDMMFDRFEALKIAYDLQKGNTKRFNRIAKLIGEY